MGLALLPLLLALGSYYRPVLLGTGRLHQGSDADFYVYQTSRMAENSGRWWMLAHDDLIGQPYPSSIARFPQLFEGLDLLLVSSVTARFLSPLANYHLLTVLVLVINGWIAAWLTWRLTGSCGWAALAVVLITLNASMDWRVCVHLHLLKLGWVLLAVWAFSRYLDAPSLGRGLLLGLAMVLVLQGSFYFGFLAGTCFGIWWLGCLAAGRLGRSHFLAAGVAGLTTALLGAVVCFPVWNMSRTSAESAEYFRRNHADLWTYSSELWQYVVSPQWGFSSKLLRPEWGPYSSEGWHYPGLVVLAAIGMYVPARLRGWRLGGTDPRFLDRLMGLSAMLVVFSLWGGPAVLVYELVPFFRSYGRSGLLAVGLWSVAAPVILFSCASRLRWPGFRSAALLGVLALALVEGDRHSRTCHGMHRPQPDPAWVSWLAQQPADVRAAVFPFDQGMPIKPEEAWLYTYYPFYLRTLHKHGTLNGCHQGLLQHDLEQRGASVESMSPNGLHFIMALGYNALIFHQEYLHSHPWIETAAWLECEAVVDDWYIYRPARKKTDEG